MSVHIDGVNECMSESALPPQEFNDRCYNISPLNLNKQRIDVHSTNVSELVTTVHSIKKIQKQHQNCESFAYPSAFTIETPLNASEDAVTPSSQRTNYWQHFHNQQISSIKKNGSFSVSHLIQKRRQSKEQDPLIKIQQQVEKLKQNIENLEKVTRKITKIYDDSTVIIKSSFNSKYTNNFRSNSIFSTSQQNIRDQISSEQNMLSDIRDKLERILMAAEQQQPKNSVDAMHTPQTKKSIIDTLQKNGTEQKQTYSRMCKSGRIVKKYLLNHDKACSQNYTR